MESELLKLGISVDYDVNWTFEKVLCDLVQNFYDSIGYKRFSKEFAFDYWLDGESYTVVMETHGNPFSLDLLCYIGASTKTGKTNYAGCFGEGFKVCVVCLIKMGICLTMESSNWMVEPEIHYKEIGGKTMKMLAYRKTYRDDDGATRLTLHHVPYNKESWLKEVLLNFYYPENPLLGELIASGNEYAVYKRSNVAIPKSGYHIPEEKGILFYKYMARGELPFPLAIFLKEAYRVNYDSRDREIFESYQLNSLITTISEKIDSFGSWKILEELEHYWCELPSIGKYSDIDTWYYLICQLVRNVARSPMISQKFREKHKNLSYLERKTDNRNFNRKIEEANKWYKQINKTVKYVNPIFRLLGAKSILDEYENYLKSVVFKEPSVIETDVFNILENTYRAIWCYGFESHSLPNVEIASDIEQMFFMEFYKKYNKRAIYSGGFKQRYLISRVIMNPKKLENKTFEEAFLEYASCCLQVFGMERSERYAAMLTEIGARIIDCFEEYLNGEKEWLRLQKRLLEQKD